MNRRWLRNMVQAYLDGWLDLATLTADVAAVLRRLPTTVHPEVEAESLIEKELHHVARA